MPAFLATFTRPKNSIKITSHDDTIVTFAFYYIIMYLFTNKVFIPHECLYLHVAHFVYN
jgi:hypothetical protein